MPTSFFRSCFGVFQGGGCRAAAFVGAYEEAVSRGVHLTEVAGTSAGSIMAALVGARANPSDLVRMLGAVNYDDLRSSPSPRTTRGLVGTLGGRLVPDAANLYFDFGLYSTVGLQQWIEECLKSIRPGRRNPITFKDLGIPTYIVSTDLKTSSAKVWSQETTPDESVAAAVQASCSIPLFFQPTADFQVDGGLVSNLPSFVFNRNRPERQRLSSRVLAFSLVSDPRLDANWGPQRYISSLMSTVVEGAQDLQLELQPNVNVISINTGDIRATDFDRMSPETNSLLMANGRAAAKHFFDGELIHVKRDPNISPICEGTDEVFSRFVAGLDDIVDEIVVAENDTKWVYSIFPALLCWRMRGVQITVIVPEYGDDPADGPYRRRLLRELGARVTELAGLDRVPMRAYITRLQDPTRSSALVGMRASPTHTRKIEAVHYQGLLHSGAIESIYERVTSLLDAERGDTGTPPALYAGHQDDLFRRLKRVSFYSRPDVELTLENVPISRLVSLARYVREYKIKQVNHLMAAYNDAKIPLFSAAAVRFASGKHSIVTPPVVECAGNNFVLIEGSSRATHCRDEGIDHFQCIVARNVAAELPGRTVPFQDVQVIGGTLPARERYSSFDYSMFRHIENNVHAVDGP